MLPLTVASLYLGSYGATPSTRPARQHGRYALHNTSYQISLFV